MDIATGIRKNFIFHREISNMSRFIALIEGCAEVSVVEEAIYKLVKHKCENIQDRKQLALLKGYLRNYERSV